MEIDLLIRFCETIGIDKTDLTVSDQYNEFRLRKTDNRGNSSKITYDSVQTITNSLWTTFDMKIFIPGDDPILEIRKGKIEQPWNAIIDLQQREPETLLQVELSINKKSVATNLGLMHQRSSYGVFYFSWRFSTLFEGLVTAWSRSIVVSRGIHAYSHPCRRCTILLQRWTTYDCRTCRLHQYFQTGIHSK